MKDKQTEKKIKNLKKEVDEIWTILKERDKYLFEILDKYIEKINNRVKKLEKKKLK